MESINITQLSAHEKYIYENKEKFIKLNEESSEFMDITDELLNLTENFSIGEMIHTTDFTLEETMNSVELNHFKMDSHYNNFEANTFKKLIREEKVKKMEDLSNEEVNYFLT